MVMNQSMPGNNFNNGGGGGGNGGGMVSVKYHVMEKGRNWLWSFPCHSFSVW